MYIKHEESHGETGQIGYPCMDATDYYHDRALSILQWALKKVQKAEKIVFLYAYVWYSTRVVRQSHPGEIAVPPRWDWSFTRVEHQMKVAVTADGDSCYNLS